MITAVGAASAGRPARQVRAAAGGVAAGPGPGPVGTVSPEGGSEAAGRAGGSEGRTDGRGGEAGREVPSSVLRARFPPAWAGAEEPGAAA